MSCEHIDLKLQNREGPRENELLEPVAGVKRDLGVSDHSMAVSSL